MKINEFEREEKPVEINNEYDPRIVDIIVKADEMPSVGPFSSDEYDVRLAELAKKYGVPLK